VERSSQVSFEEAEKARASLKERFGDRQKPYMWPTFFSSRRHHIDFYAYERAVLVRVFHAEGSKTEILLDPLTLPSPITDTLISSLLETCECHPAVVKEIEPARTSTIPEVWDKRHDRYKT